jgi:quaternary ammonium compound-resistance protein SugE
MAWIYLFIAGLFEVIWAIALKYCNGFKLSAALAIVISGMVCSVGFLGLAMREIPIGTAYAIWTGIGIIGVAFYGISIFGESSSFTRLLCLTMILLGIAGLKLKS